MSNVTVRIPATLEDLGDALNSRGRLMQNTRWEVAAFCAAFVHIEDSQGGDRRSKANTPLNRESTAEFAARGFHGLKQPSTVRRYVRAWLDEHDGIYPEQGALVVLPEKKFPKQTSSSHQLVTNPDAVRHAIRTRPEIAAAALTALDETVAGVAEFVVETNPELAREITKARFDEERVEGKDRGTAERTVGTKGADSLDFTRALGELAKAGASVKSASRHLARVSNMTGKRRDEVARTAGDLAEQVAMLMAQVSPVPTDARGL